MLYIYILVLGLIDAIAYLLVNRIIIISKLFIVYCVLFVCIILIVHLNFLNWHFLLPLNEFLMCLVPLIGCLVIGYFGLISIKKNKESIFLNDQQKIFAEKLYSILFYKILYILAFLTQIVFLVNYLK